MFNLENNLLNIVSHGTAISFCPICMLRTPNFLPKKLNFSSEFRLEEEEKFLNAESYYKKAFGFGWNFQRCRGCFAEASCIYAGDSLFPLRNVVIFKINAKTSIGKLF